MMARMSVQSSISNWRWGRYIPLLLILLFTSCRSPSSFREEADREAYSWIQKGQEQAFGEARDFSIERPADALRRRLLLEQNLPVSGEASLGAGDVQRIPQWPDASYSTETTNASVAGDGGPLKLSLLDALQVGARSSRDYQRQKERVFQAALQLDLEADAFRSSWSGVLSSILSTDLAGEEEVSGVETSFGLGWDRAFKTGESIAVNLGVDLANLLTQESGSALGILADATLSIPLLRGSSRFVVTEPLTQAQRNVMYALHDLERFRRTFSVEVASSYLGVLQQMDQLRNARENYRRLILSTRRARRLADAGQLPEIQVDQARQDELRARNRWVSAQISLEQSLDQFKIQLGLPPDAAVELDPSELERLADEAEDLVRQGETKPDVAAAPKAADDPVELQALSWEEGGALEIPMDDAVRLALQNRLDLRNEIGRVFDAQRDVAVAADQLRADADLLGRARAGEARALSSVSQGDGELNLGDGRYSAELSIDLPFERTDERNTYRNSLIGFEVSVRSVQNLEDQVKLQVRNALRSLLESRESASIQARAVDVARRRLDSTSMFLEAGRAEIRDVLEAEEALVSAQNALSAALVQYRVNELELQRDMGVLEVTEKGLWVEFDPASMEDHEGLNHE